MPAVQNQPQDLESIGALAMLIASLCVVYWRTALRVAAILVIALTIYGAVLVIDGLRHAAG
jgi:amino acid permease